MLTPLKGHRPLLPLLLTGLLGSGGCTDQPSPSDATESSSSASSDSGPRGTSDAGPVTTAADSTGIGMGTRTGTSSSSSTSSSPTAETAPGTDSGEGTGTGDPPEPPTLPLCGTAPPPGATLAPELPSFGGGGMCPVLETDGTLNVMNTGGGDRELIVVVPSDWEQGEQLPVIVLYHWLGASADGFYDRAEAQAAADHYRFIALIPEGREIEDLVPFRWPFAVSDLDFLMEQDFQFLDDMLACAHEQFGIDKECVSVMGVSAGAMFSSMIASRHGSRIASLISLSGGVGGLIKPWQAAEHVMPAMVL
ncbi:MAG: alpha/beta fold hydrolase, partial [Nannocystaceae bacterium]|nr:alpha/beta fold hydrolase [Nannocystaceae bacterium]